MSDVVAGTRDSRGEWQPAERPEVAPIWSWPPRPRAVLNRHGRYVTFQLAEVAVSKILFQKILALIDDLRRSPVPA